MSMLTPPGMGGQYRIKGDRYPRMRRPRHRGRIVLASVAAIVALGLLGWGSLQLVDVFSGQGGTKARAAGKGDAKKCTPYGGVASAAPAGDTTKGGPADEQALPEPKSITVNVLNATKRSGLAGRTAKELKKRGFTIGQVANAPKSLDHQVDAPALFIGATGADTLARMKVLGAQVEGSKTRYDNRKGEDVDLVIGKGFTELAGTKQAAKTIAALTEPSPKPTPHC
jgi:LytR cell envelope-related transcriptional attenuator